MSRNLKLIFSYEKILQAVQSMAGAIQRDLSEHCSTVDAVTFVVLLKGGARFGFDLMSRYPGAFYYDFAGVSSYSEGTRSSGVVEFYHFSLRRDLIDQRVVVILDDICDSGLTFARVAERIEREFDPLVVKSCALVHRQGSTYHPDYFGLSVSGEDYFVGYGLGMGEEYRHLNGIYSVTLG